MRTSHKIIIGDSRDAGQIKNASVALTVTSPPYPLVEMWDEMFSEQNPEIIAALDTKDGNLAFELMHKELDKVWEDVARVTIEGGFAAINIGDATRKIGDDFRLYSNHSRIISKFVELGFDVLPSIIWRKTTNAPNKFMGSGMLPSGAYVTLEHEYILIFRKGGRRVFSSSEEKKNRNASAYFWEERNKWFSDSWDLNGVLQKMKSDKTRTRSAAYPFEIPFRLINMYSCFGDTVYDPFLGTGTTSFAAAVAGRNSVGYEIEESFEEVIFSEMGSLPEFSFKNSHNRLTAHLDFMQDYFERKGAVKHQNELYDFPVVTSQEKQLTLSYIDSIERNELGFSAHYKVQESPGKIEFITLHEVKPAKQTRLF
jgi:modification methylase